MSSERKTLSSGKKLVETGSFSPYEVFSILSENPFLEQEENQDPIPGPEEAVLANEN